MSLGIRMLGIEVVGILVGVIGATMVRGDRGGEVGGVVEEEEIEEVVIEDILFMEGREAESGLQESLRRQLKQNVN